MEQETNKKIKQLEERMAELEKKTNLEDTTNVGYINRDKFVVTSGKETSATTASGYVQTLVNGVEYKVLVV